MIKFLENFIDIKSSSRRKVLGILFFLIYSIDYIIESLSLSVTEELGINCIETIVNEVVEVDALLTIGDDHVILGDIIAIFKNKNKIDTKLTFYEIINSGDENVEQSSKK